jgi:cell division protein FtsN
MRLLLVMIFLVASAVWLNFSGLDLISEARGKKAASKKISAVKPKFLREKVKEEEIPVYTFFETLNDPTMTRHVGLDGKIIPEQPTKISAPVVSPNNEVPPSINKIIKSEPVTKLEKKQEIETNSPPVIEKPIQFAVQVGSFRDEKRAGTLKMRLQKKGFDAFLMQIEVAEKAWHRVFLGRYADEKKAQAAALLARNEFKLNAVVVSKTN